MRFTFKALGFFKLVILALILIFNYGSSKAYTNASSSSLFNIDIEEVTTPFICKNNATNVIDGQFQKEIIFKGDPHDQWTVVQAYNFFRSSSPNPPAAPVEFEIDIDPDTLIRESIGQDVLYRLDGIVPSNKQFRVVIKNMKGKYLEFGDQAPIYDVLTIDGSNSVCPGEQVEYRVTPSPEGFHPNITDGLIVDANTDSSSIIVRWPNDIGVQEVKFYSKSINDCLAPATLKVAIGSTTSSIACKNNIRVSIDGTCTFEVTPDLVSPSRIDANSPYIIELYNKNMTAIEGSYIDHNLVGKELIVKMKEGCGGNSCWGTLYVEDKLPPQLICLDTIPIACLDFDHYIKPLIIDNCAQYSKLLVLDSVAIEKDCDESYTKKIKISYQAIDHNGLKSNQCQQVIVVERLKMKEIDFPKNLKKEDALRCELEYQLDENGHPHPNITGYPQLHGKNIYGEIADYCNASVYYNDEDYGYIDCHRKILRTWTVFEWHCSGSRVETKEQLILITDNEAPEFTCPDNLKSTVSGHNCEAVVQLPSISDVIDNCSGFDRVEVKVPSGILKDTNNLVANFETGIHTVQYRVYDNCGNRRTCEVEVNVNDETPPVMACDQNTTISLNSQGKSYLYPESLDDGTYDQCGLDSLRLRRAESNLICNAQIGYQKILEFCCEDTENPIMVELAAWDVEGNKNSCMVFIRVQDKTPPKLTCPKNDTISCEVFYDLNDLSLYGIATAEDACGITITETAQDSVNQCRVGYIERVFHASDSNGSARCTSYIHIVKPFNPIVVKWPGDYSTVDTCSELELTPDNLPSDFAYPEYNDGICDLFGADYKDSYFSFDDNGSCYKIIRRWTVIDYCRMDENGYEPLVHDQVIKVSNTIAPEILLDVDTTRCTNNNDCNYGLVELLAYGNDDCTPLEILDWNFAVDLDFNGVFSEDDARSGTGDTIDASQNYPVGNHRIRFTFADKCGNLTTRVHDFTVNNCKGPTAACQQSMSVSLGDMTIDNVPVKMACVTASSLDASSFHFCGYDISFSFSENALDSVMCFDCDNIGMNEVRMYAVDQFGQSSFCTVNIEVQNNDGIDLSISGDDEICAGESVTLELIGASSGDPLIWSTGETTSMINVSPDSTQTYTVTVSNASGCNIVVSKEIVVNKVEIDLLGSNSLCLGDTKRLEAQGAVSYLWSTGATTSFIDVSPEVETSYSVSATDINGCESSETITLTIDEDPTGFTISGTSPICEGEGSTLVVENLPVGTSYEWSTGVQGAPSTVVPTETDTYSVTVTSDKGCSASESFEIVVFPSPDAQITGDSDICEGESTTLTAHGGDFYIWNVDNITAQSITVLPNTNSVYTVTVTNTFGCRDVESLMVLVTPVPSISISGENEVCLGDSIDLTVVGAPSSSTFLWSPDGQTTQTVTISPEVNTLYSVQSTLPNGCQVGRSTIITVLNCPGNNALVNGQILNANGQPIKNYEFALEGDNVAMDDNTNNEGQFTFGEMPANGTYQVIAKKEDQLLEGVSTLDLILIQRHLLQIESIEDPYSLLAADVNGDRKIRTNDLVMLRKALLGKASNFGDNSPWYAINQSYVFEDNSNPWTSPLPENIRLENIRGRIFLDFIGIKIGDVNQSYLSNFQGNMHNRSNTNLSLKKAKMSSEANESLYHIYLDEGTVLKGGQFSMEFEHSFNAKLSSEILNEGDYYSSFVDGVLRVIITPKENILIKDVPLFELRCSECINLSWENSILLTDHLAGEIYTDVGTSEVQLIHLDHEIQHGKRISVYPNPYEEELLIDYLAARSSNALVSIYSADGSQWYNESIKLKEGHNQIRIENNDKQKSGVYFLFIQTPDGKEVHQILKQ